MTKLVILASSYPFGAILVACSGEHCAGTWTYLSFCEEFGAPHSSIPTLARCHLDRLFVFSRRSNLVSDRCGGHSNDDTESHYGTGLPVYPVPYP